MSLSRDELLILLKVHEWNETYEESECMSCGSFAKGTHAAGCKMAEAIAWLEDEGNKELVDDRSNGSENKGVWWGWVLR